MTQRLRGGRGPSPRYCAVCGGEIAAMQPDTCVNGTAHISEVEWERVPVVGLHSADELWTSPWRPANYPPIPMQAE